MEQYAMYLRKSRKDADLEKADRMETLAKHEKILDAYARDNGLNVVKKFKEVVSGESLANRPQLNMLLDEMYDNKYKGVLVMETERLTRGNAKDQGVITEAFKYTNTLLITPSKTYDPMNPTDQQFFELGMAISRIEYQTLQRRMIAGKNQSIIEGNYMGSLPPYGYDIDKRGRNNRTLKFNDQSKYIPMMFEWFVNDRLNAGEIARKLTDMKVPTRTGKKEWNRATVKDILKNHLYIGKVRWDRRKVTREFENGELTTRKRRQLAENYMIYEGKHEALISEELFNAAQKLFKNQVPKHTDSKVSNPFAGLLKCKHCGKIMRYQGYAHKKNTRARLVHPESKFCKVKSAYFDDVYEAVIKALQFEVSEFEYKMSSDFATNENKRLQLTVDAMKKELEKLQAQRARIYTLYETEGIYSTEEFIERRTKVEEDIDEIKNKLMEESSKVVDTNEYFEKSIQLKNVIEALLNKNVDAKIKNNMLKDNINYILYSVENDELLLEVY